MLRVDLKGAVDAEGRVADFHAWRHTYVSALAADPTVPVKTLQTLARHRTPDLTLRRYAHSRRQDQKAALAALPAPTADPGSDMDSLSRLRMASRVHWARRGSNPHAGCPAGDFKSPASAVPPLALDCEYRHAAGLLSADGEPGCASRDGANSVSRSR